MKKDTENDQLDEMLKNIYFSESPRVFEISSDERNDRAEVIREKKTKPVKYAVAAVFVAFAACTGAIFSSFHNKNDIEPEKPEMTDKAEVSDNKNENTDNGQAEEKPDLTGDPEEIINQGSLTFHGLNGLACSDSRIYCSSDTSYEKYENKVIYYSSDGSTHEISIGGSSVPVVYCGKDSSYVVYSGEDCGTHLCRLDNSDLKIKEDVRTDVSGDVKVIKQNNEGNLLLLTYDYTSDDHVIPVISEYDSVTFKLLNTTKVRDHIPSEYDPDKIDNVILGDDGYFAVLEEDRKYDMIKLSYENGFICSAEDICSFNGEKCYYSGAVTDADGDLAVFGFKYDDAPAKGNHYFRIFDTSDLSVKEVHSSEKTGTIASTSEFGSIQFSYGNACGDYDFLFYETDAPNVISGYRISDYSKHPLIDTDHDPGMYSMNRYASNYGENILASVRCRTEYFRGKGITVLDHDGKELNKLYLIPENTGEEIVSLYSGKNTDLYVLSYRDDGQYKIYQISPDGVIVSENVLDKPSGEGIVYRDLISDGERITCISDDRISVFSSDGKFVSDIVSDEYKNEHIVSGIDSDYLVASDNESNSHIFRILYGEEKLESVVVLEYMMTGAVCDGKGGYDLLFADDDGIMGGNPSEFMFEELVSRYRPEYQGTPVMMEMLDQERVLLCYNESMMSDIFRLDIVNIGAASDNEQKIDKIFEIGCYGDVPDISEYVKLYNNDHRDSKLEIRDYSKTKDDPCSALKADIESGMLPDIILGTGNADFKRYAEAGAFADISEYLEDFYDSDYQFINTRVVSMFASGEKQYLIPVRFMVNTILGKSEEFDKDRKISFSELFEMNGGKGCFSGVSSEEFVNRLIKDDLAEYVDFESRECSFDAPEFTALLEFIKNNSGSGADNKNSLLRFFDLSRYYDPRLFDLELEGEKGAFLGLPSADGKEMSLSASVLAAVSEAAADKAEAFDIIYGYMEHFYESAPYENGGFSSSVFVNDSLYQTNEMYDEHTDFEGDYSKIKKIIRNATRATYYDSEIFAIIDEETAKYFSGKQSAEDTAGNIQSRVKDSLGKITAK